MVLTVILSPPQDLAMPETVQPAWTRRPLMWRSSNSQQPSYIAVAVCFITCCLHRSLCAELYAHLQAGKGRLQDIFMGKMKKTLTCKQCQGKSSLA